MKKVVYRFLITISLILGLTITAITFPVFSTHSYANEDQPAITITEKSTEAVLNYLNEVYTEKFPNLGLELRYDSPTDKEDLHKLREEITYGLSDDKEITEALYDWILDNIEYDSMCTFVDTPASVLHHRAAVCYGFANLFQAFLRDSGIPAVVCCGFRGDMVDYVSVEEIRHEQLKGHAWVYVYLNNQWYLYDPLWDIKGTTDVSFISKWYFTEYVEGIVPHYEGIDYQMPYTKEAFFYKDGKFMYLYEGNVVQNREYSLDINSIEFRAYSCREGYRSSFRIENEEGIKELSDYDDGELLASGWLLSTWINGERVYVPHQYLFDNGIKAVNTIVFRGDQAYYCMYDVIEPISSEFAKTCRMDMGRIILHVGDSITWDALQLHSYIYNNIADPQIVYSAESDGQDVDYVTIDDNGVIEAIKPGYVTVNAKVVGEEVPFAWFDLIVEDDLNNVGAEIKGLTEQKYTGEKIEPQIQVYVNGKELVKNGEYLVKYENNIQAGTAKVTVMGVGVYSGEISGEFKIIPPDNGEKGYIPADAKKDVPEDYDMLFRMYNPNTGEHFYTTSRTEGNNLVEAGWTYEGEGWIAPKGGKPVYRLYNSNTGDHHYTMSEREKNKLVELGWVDEKVGWYSDEENGKPLYRLYNPNTLVGQHHYTTSKRERDRLISAGWNDEGIAWYGYAE